MVKLKTLKPKIKMKKVLKLEAKIEVLSGAKLNKIESLKPIRGAIERN